MKIILQQDVEKLGKSGQIKEVSDGYARNYLIPRGLAMLASASSINLAKQQATTRHKQEEREHKEAGQLAASLAETTLTIKAKVGEQHRLFGSITAADIAEELEKTTGFKVDRRKIHVSEPIRSIGSHTVDIHLGPDLNPTLTVVVEPE